MKKEEEMVITEQVPRGKWDQERVDELALGKNGIYLHVPLKVIL